MTTSRNAVLLGQLLINIPIIFFLFYVSIKLDAPNSNQQFSALTKIIGFVASLIIALLYRSIALTKWRLWAYKNTPDLDDLKFKALKSTLIWSEKGLLEYRNSQERKMLHSLETNYNVEGKYSKDGELQNETKIFFSKRKLIWTILFCISFAIFGLLIFFFLKDVFSKTFGLIMFGLFSYLAIPSIKQLLNTTSQIILSNDGITIKNNPIIKWNCIYNESITTEHLKGSELYHLEFDHNHGKEKICINDFDLSKVEIEKLLRIYKERNI